MFSLNSWAAESIQAQSIDSIRQYYQIKINYRQASIDEKLRARDEVLNILSLYRKENPFDADIAAAEIHLESKSSGYQFLFDGNHQARLNYVNTPDILDVLDEKSFRSRYSKFNVEDAFNKLTIYFTIE